MRMRGAEDQILFTNSKTGDAKNVADIKCEPEDVNEYALFNNNIGIEDVKPSRSELLPSKESSVTINNDEESPGPSNSTSIWIGDEEPLFADQFFSNKYSKSPCSSDVKSCVGDSSTRIQIKVVTQDIISVEADAIVNAVDVDLKSDDDMIVTAGGSKMQTELDELRTTSPPPVISDGYCFATNPHGIESCQVVFHTVVPRLSQSPTRMEEYLLRTCYLNCLSAGEENGFTKMAFSVLGSHQEDISKFSVLVALQSALLHLQLNQNPRLREVIFVTSDDGIYELFKSNLDGRSEMEVSVASVQEVRTRMERQHVHNRLLHVSPVSGLPFSVASFVPRYIDDAERKRILRMAHSTPDISKTAKRKGRGKGRKNTKTDEEILKEKRFKSALRQRELRQSEEYKQREKEKRSNPESRAKMAERTRKLRAKKKMEGKPAYVYNYSAEQLEDRRLKSAARMRELRKNEEWRKKDQERRAAPERRARKAARSRERIAERDRGMRERIPDTPMHLLAKQQLDQILAKMSENDS